MEQLIPASMSRIECFNISEFLKENQPQFATSGIFLLTGIYLTTFLYNNSTQSAIPSHLVLTIQIVVILSSVIFWVISWNIIADGFSQRSTELPLRTFSFAFGEKNVKLSFRMGDLGRLMIFPAYITLLLAYWSYLNWAFLLFFPIVVPLNLIYILIVLMFKDHLLSYSKNLRECSKLSSKCAEDLSDIERYSNTFDELYSAYYTSMINSLPEDQKISMMLSVCDTLVQKIKECKESAGKRKSLMDLDMYSDAYARLERMENRVKKTRDSINILQQRIAKIENTEAGCVTPPSAGASNCDSTQPQ